jgi:hypothetical protein
MVVVEWIDVRAAAAHGEPSQRETASECVTAKKPPSRIIYTYIPTMLYPSPRHLTRLTATYRLASGNHRACGSRPARAVVLSLVTARRCWPRYTRHTPAVPRPSLHVRPCCGARACRRRAQQIGHPPLSLTSWRFTPPSRTSGF